MSEKYDGGNAFPSEDNPHGLTIRDYFAIGVLASKYMSETAYEQADAMLEARKGEQS